MERRITVVTDSSCDLPGQLLEEYGIEVVPLGVHFGTETYLDGDLSADEFWEKAAGPHHPRTSQPALGTFEEAFGRLVDKGREVLCVTVTGKHSGTFNVAQLAAQRFGDAVKVFDSFSFSVGLGIQALSAAQAARAGRSAQEILSMLENLRERMPLLVVLDTLENLRRGGRADAFIAVADRMARALNIKIITNVVEGQLRLLGAARSFKSAMRRVLDQVEAIGAVEHLAVVHTRNQEMAERVAKQLAERTGFSLDKIWVRETGAVLSSHAGPGVIGVLAVPAPPAD
jgi:DegV family protein with EDD domain